MEGNAGLARATGQLRAGLFIRLVAWRNSHASGECDFLDWAAGFSESSSELAMPKKQGPDTKQSATLVYPRIYIGPFTAASDVAFLHTKAITHVLSIGHTPTSHVPGVTYLRLSLVDSESSSVDKVCATAAPFLDEALAQGAVLVHCSAGVSRSPTIVAAYLMRRHSMTLFDALGSIITARQIASPNSGFLTQLKELDVRLHGASSLGVDVLPRKRVDRVALFQRTDKTSGKLC